MIHPDSNDFKPEIIHPNSHEYQTLVADLKKREQSLEPDEKVARHPEYPHVFATDQGRVINAWERSEAKPARIAAVHQNKNGYLQCGVTIAKGKYRKPWVHRIILESFRGPAPEGHETCHRNSVRTDNRLENLYWGTPGVDQVNDKRIAGSVLVGEKHGQSVLTNALVIDARKRVKAGETVAALAREFGVSQVTLNLAVYGEHWTCLDDLEPPAIRGANQSSRFRGPTWKKDAEKWQAKATIEGKRTHLGLFDNEADAVFFFERQIRLDPSCKSRSNNLLSFDFRNQPEAVSDDVQNAKPIGYAKPAGFQAFAKPKAKPESKDDGGKA